LVKFTVQRSGWAGLRSNQQLAPRGVEGLANRHCEVILGLLINAQLATRKSQIDSHLERTAAVVMANGAFHGDVAAADTPTLVIVLESLGLFPDFGFDGRIQGEIAGGDLQIALHVPSSAHFLRDNFIFIYLNISIVTSAIRFGDSLRRFADEPTIEQLSHHVRISCARKRSRFFMMTPIAPVLCPLAPRCSCTAFAQPDVGRPELER